MRFERREDVSLPALFIAPFAAIAVTLVLCAGLIAMAGVNPLTAYAEMLKGAFGSRLSVTETLTRATPLILTGLAAAVAFRARLWNIGGEGQFYIGALVAAGLGHDLVSGLPVPLAIAVLMLAGMAAGALLLVGPALMRLRFGVDEVVTTLLVELHRAPVRRADDRGAAARPDGLWLAAIGAGGLGVAAARPCTTVTAACRTDPGARGGRHGLAGAGAHGLWRGDAGGGAEPARRRLCRGAAAATLVGWRCCRAGWRGLRVRSRCWGRPAM